MTAHQTGYINCVRENIQSHHMKNDDLIVEHKDGKKYKINYFGGRTELK